MPEAPYRVFAFASNPWLGPWMNRQQLLSRLARDAFVLYSNGAWSVWDRDRPEWRVAGLRSRIDNHDGAWLHLPARFALRWPRVPAWDHAVLARQARRMRRFSRAYSRGPRVAYLFEPSFLRHGELLDPDLTIYHAYDLYKRMPGWSDQSEAAHCELATRAGLVIGTSQPIVDWLAESGAREAMLLPNGVDSGQFIAAGTTPRAPHPELADIPRPRIGYTGRLNRKVDFPLVAWMAQARPDWQFVLIGEVLDLDAATREAFEVCRRQRNVHLLGERPHELLAAYVASMDVNIMCYRLGPGLWTRGIYPLKLNEYLAAGRPMVSAALPSVQDFRDAVAVAVTRDDWLRLIDDALHDDETGTFEQRQAIAVGNDWEVRVAVLRDAIEERLAALRSASSLGNPDEGDT